MKETGLFDSLAARLSLMVFVFTIVPLGLTAYFEYRHNSVLLKEEALELMALDIDKKVEYAEQSLEMALPDLLSLGRNISHVLTNKGGLVSADVKNQMAYAMKGELSENKHYVQARVLDLAGKEIVRVNHFEHDPVRVQEHQLQDKSGKFYFKVLSDDDHQGDVHVSMPSLNRDFGRLTEPLTLVLRVGLKIRDDKGKILCFLVFNINTDLIFGNEKPTPKNGLLVIDDEGTYLRHWDDSVLYGKDLGHKANLLEEEPELRKNIGMMQSKIHLDQSLNEYRVWKKLFIDFHINNSFASSGSLVKADHDKSRYLVLMKRLPQSTIMSKWRDLVLEQVILFSVVSLASLLFIMFGINHILHPLGFIRAAMEKVAGGEKKVTLPEKTGVPELSRMVAAFNVMTAEIELRKQEVIRSNAFFRSISRAAPNAFFVADRVGTILQTNPAATRIFGYSEEELLGKNVSMLAPKAVMEQHDLYIHRYLSTKRPRILGRFVEAEGRRKNGTIFPISTYVTEARIGMESHFIGIITDISEQKEMTDKLVKANDEIKSFANIVSHDLRAPMVNIKGFIGELKHSMDEISEFIAHVECTLPKERKAVLKDLIDVDMRESLSFIDTSATLIDHLIEQILTLSRLGRRELEFEKIRVPELVDTIVESLAFQKSEVGAVISCGDLPDCIADKSALEQIFGNLLSNALKYLDPDRKGDILVWGEKRSGTVTYRVKDNGRGISARDHKKVFEIFRRAGKQNVKGEGMGLAYVKTLVRRHNGEVWLESEENVGSTFSFTVAVNKKSRENGNA